MAGFAIKTNAKIIGKRFNKRSVEIAKVRIAHKKAIILLDSWVQRNFEAEGTLHEGGNNSWPALKPSTLKARRKKGAGGKKLQDEGNLKRDWDLVDSNKEGSLKSGHGYSRVHEKGTKNVPKRKIFPTIKQGKKIVLPAYNDFINKAIK